MPDTIMFDEQKVGKAQTVEFNDIAVDKLVGISNLTKFQTIIWLIVTQATSDHYVRTFNKLLLKDMVDSGSLKK
jgi:hypothetical protein